ncbi:hypothetical protein [Streptomyces sp. SHP 1-2]|uniref:hypothetical protein n=1 Tax=Streptomyces sp. SHP 1-2 TaxID=2769489 RepID=UPI0039DF6421
MTGSANTHRGRHPHHDVAEFRRRTGRTAGGPLDRSGPGALIAFTRARQAGLGFTQPRFRLLRNLSEHDLAPDGRGIDDADYVVALKVRRRMIRNTGGAVEQWSAALRTAPHPGGSGLPRSAGADGGAQGAVRDSGAWPAR